MCLRSCKPSISPVLARWVLPAPGLPHANTVAHVIDVATQAVTSYIARNRLTFRRKQAPILACAPPGQRVDRLHVTPTNSIIRTP